MAIPLNEQVGRAAADLVERLQRSVVEVRTPGGGHGAGTIWRPDGLIVTNHHVAPRERAEVVLPNGGQIEGAVVARDERNDLALIEVPRGGLPAVAVGNSRSLRVGELVVAVGHPFGIRGAATIGVISAALPPRPVPLPVREMVRADVLLGPGNSGGPLADARGRVVGINAMVVGGMALAVPDHLVERLVMARAVRRRVA